MAGAHPTDRVVEHCTLAMIHALITHGDLDPRCTAEPLRVSVDYRGDAIDVSLVWRALAADGVSSEIRETAWTLSSCSADPRSPRSAA